MFNSKPNKLIMEVKINVFVNFVDKPEERASDSDTQEYPYSEGEEYFTISQERGGASIVKSYWDSGSEDLHSDDKLYFRTAKEALSYARSNGMTLALTITKDRFLDWYFNHGQDSEKKMLMLELADTVIGELFQFGYSSASVETIFDSCNKEAIVAYFTREFDKMTDDFDAELSSLGVKYTITLD